MSQIYKYFTPEELGCGHCIKEGITDSHLNMDSKFMEKIVILRERMAFPFIVTSAYRCPNHPIEARKSSPGAHSSGQAIDIHVVGKKAYRLLGEALAMNFIGIGVNQKGEHSGRFIHVDDWFDGSRPNVWSY